MRRPIARVSRREHLTAVRGQLDGLAALAGVQKPEYVTRIPEQRAPRQPSSKRPERLILREVLRVLRSHPRVVIAWRMQSGLFQMDDRPIRVGVVGMPDIIGMLKGGRMFAIEVKSEDGQLSESQAYWLETIRAFGGVAGVARCGEDVYGIIA